MKNFYKKYKIEIISVLITTLIFLLICLFNKIYPFGSNHLSRYDGFFQYPGFTSYFRSVLLGKNSLFYSFKGLLGYNFYATSIYYLLNPTNILSVFFNNNHLIEYYNFIVYLRIALCAFTMSKYLKYKFDYKKNSNYLYIIMFSVAYALMAYNVCYFFNYMYFDTVAILPLVIIGLEKLIYERKTKMYIVTLTIAILSNFYIGFMVCIFCLLYFIYSYILLEKKDKSIIKDFAISSLLCGLMSMIVLLPVAYELLQGKAVLYSDPLQTNYFAFNLNFVNIFYKFIPGSMITFDIKYGSVNIYCTMLTLVLIIKYFYNTKISNKEKIVTGAFILFFILSISFNLIDYAWHLMQCPIWYPNRYIFTFAFFLLMIACKSLINIEYCEMSSKAGIRICIVLILLMVVPAINARFYTSITKIICIVFGLLLLFEYMLLIKNKKAWVLVFGLYFIEILLNGAITIDQLSINKSVSTYKIENQIYEDKVEYVKSLEKDKNNFYRMELSSILNYNNGASYDYNGVNLFSSLRNGRIMDIFEYYLGYKVSNKSNLNYNFKNPYINSLIGIKYLSGNDKETYYDNLHFDTNGGITLYRNNDALSLGYMVSDKVYDYKFVKEKYYDNIKEIANTMLDEDMEVYNKLVPTYNDVKFVDGKSSDDSKKKTIDITTNGKNPYILYSGVAKKSGFIVINKNVQFYSKVTIFVNKGDFSTITADSTSLYIKKGSKYSIRYELKGTTCKAETFDVFFYNYDDYKHLIDENKNNELKITNYKSDSNLEGVVSATKDKSVLFTTIPYDKGWNIYVDDVKKDFKACYNAFICLDLPEGNHSIKMKYTPSWFVIGSALSIIGLISSIIYTRKRKK